MCGNTDNLQSDEQKDEVSNGLASSTAGGSSFTPESLQKILDMLRFLLGRIESGGRRRRSAEVEVKVNTPEEVRVIFTIYHYLPRILRISSNFCS